MEPAFIVGVIVAIIGGIIWAMGEGAELENLAMTGKVIVGLAALFLLAGAFNS